MAFPIALVVLLGAALIYFFLQPNRGDPLRYLESTWSFKESWASNVTVAAGLIAGIFGSSDVVTNLVGDNGKSSVALATVGAAVAAALVAAGPLIVASSKTKDDYLSVGGLLAASAVTLAGGFGEIWVLFRAGERLNLGGWQDAAAVMAVLAGLLLAWYALRSTPAVIRSGQKEPPMPPPSDTLTAAKMIVEALRGAPGVDTVQIDSAFKVANELHPELQEGVSFDSPHKRRTALL